MLVLFIYIYAPHRRHLHLLPVLIFIALGVRNATIHTIRRLCARRKLHIKPCCPSAPHTGEFCVMWWCLPCTLCQVRTLANYSHQWLQPHVIQVLHSTLWQAFTALTLLLLPRMLPHCCDLLQERRTIMAFRAGVREPLGEALV